MSIKLEQISATINKAIEEHIGKVHADLSKTMNAMMGAIDTLLKENATQTVQIATLEKKIDALAADKKPAKGKKEAPVAVDTASTSAAASPVAAAAKPKAYPNNRLVYFRQMFVEDAAFRERFTIKDILDECEKNPKVSGKTDPIMRLKALASEYYSKVKDNKELVARLTSEFTAKKAEFAKSDAAVGAEEEHEADD